MTDAAATDRPAPRAATVRGDVASAYAAAAARLVAWLLVSALLFRHDAAAYALLALVRATVGLLNYTTLGLAPAMVNQLAAARVGRRTGGSVADLVGVVYSNGTLAAWVAAAVGLAALAVYSAFVGSFHPLPPTVRSSAGLVVLLMGVGTLLRLASDAAGAALQTHGRIRLDNHLLAGSELAWTGLSAASMRVSGGIAVGTAAAFAVSGALLLAGRLLAARSDVGFVLPRRAALSVTAVRRLLGFGLLVAVAQAADFLYAPTDYVLISRYLGTADVAVYAPAVQVDAALALVTTALAAALLPRAALAHAAGDPASVRRYYARGTLASIAVLLPLAALAWVASPIAFRLWLGNDLPATRAILPLVLVHTVVGGSAAVGRSVLLAVGRVRAYAASVLVAGALNVALSWLFVSQFGLGLRGIICGTIVAVVLRCGVWMPWYVTRVLNRPTTAP